MKQIKIKNIGRYILIAAVLLLAVYAFWDSLEDAWQEIQKISPWKIGLILVLSFAYQMLDGANITILASQGIHKLKLITGELGMLTAAFFRVITFGSGAGVATIAFLVKEKYHVSEATGISAINYMLHKITIALLCIGMMVFRFTVVRQQYQQYFGYLFLSILLVSIIILVYWLMCTSHKFHAVILAVLDKFNRNSRHDAWVNQARQQFGILEIYSEKLLSSKPKIALILLLDVIKFLCWYSIPYVLLSGTTQISYLDCITRMSFVVAIAGVLPSPAGIGSTEFSFLMLFTGVAASSVLLSTVLTYRSATFVFTGLLGGAAVLAAYIKTLIHRIRVRQELGKTGTQ